MRWLLWRDRVLILVYHDPKPELMDLHLKYICKIAEPIRLVDFRQPSRGRPRVVITIDDGHIGNRRLLDVFQKHNVCPTIFLCSCIVGTHRQFWWRHSNQVANQAERLKRMTNTERLSELAILGFRQDAERDIAVALSAQDVQQMRPFVDFQSHGRFHPILTCCDDEECEVEIVQSRGEIMRLVGGDCRHFAFPNGNYGEREITLLKSAGYLAARTLDLGWNDHRTDPFRLKAVPVSDDSSCSWLAVQMSMLPTYLRYMLHGSFGGRFPQFRCARPSKSK